MRVAVIGAGLGGLCLARGLHESGVEAEIFERDPTIAARFQGYRLMLDPVGDQALRGCLPQRLHPLLDAIVSDVTASGLVLDAQLNRIGELGAARTGIAVDRDVLRRLLLSGVTVRTDSAMTDYDLDAECTVVARFADGGGTRADVLVGADGVNSTVRSKLAPQIVPTDTGVRFAIGRTPLTEQFTSLERAFGAKVTGDGLSLLLGAMRFRVPPRQAAARIAPEVTLPDVGDYVRWAMILPPGTALDVTNPQDAVLSMISGWHPDLQALIEQADPDNSTLLSIRVVEPGPRWTPGPVTLLGDAVHATSPTGGNGANTALRDADLLRSCLQLAADGSRDLFDAVDEYERQMFVYGAEAVRHSLRALPTYTAATATPAGEEDKG